MNKRINDYLDGIEAFLLASEAIRSYRILRRQVSMTDGKFRCRVEFVDQSTAEFFIYIEERIGQLSSKKYSFHWQDSTGKLLRRWDNAPHYPHLPGAPNHIHEANGSVSGFSSVPDLRDVLEQIEREVSK